MIDIRVDEAYAFDYLSILSIKATLTENDKKNYNECYQYIFDQLGENIFHSVLVSEEYRFLLLANRVVFDFVSIIRNGGEVTSKELDDANMTRYKCKAALQRKFFNNEVTESKTI